MYLHRIILREIARAELHNEICMCSLSLTMRFKISVWIMDTMSRNGMKYTALCMCIVCMNLQWTMIGPLEGVLKASTASLSLRIDPVSLGTPTQSHTKHNHSLLHHVAGNGKTLHVNTPFLGERPECRKLHYER